MRELVVLEHMARAGVSAFADVLDGRTALAPWRRIDVPSGAVLPEDVNGLAGVLIMGGGMSAVDPSHPEWMIPEMAWLERVVTADVPVLGICLGAQLLATALGGEVHAREVPEMGYLELTRTALGRTDEVIAGWPDGATMLFVHEDEVTTLPPGADALLSGSDGTPSWRLGSALAVQGHPEVTAAQLEGWIAGGRLRDMFESAGVDPTTLAEEGRRRERLTVPLGRALVGRWIDGPVRHRAG